MPKPRHCQISLDATPYYHCISRCVRRAFLCGQDNLTGRSYEHRRGWVEQRLMALSQVFAIDLCAYAVMSNHTHVVLHINAEKASSWMTDEVIERWHSLFSGTVLSQRFLRGEALGDAELRQLASQVETWRERLHSISWFMRCLNEDVARQANAEDGCSGRFWEGRFKCQALLDETALAACLAYVDLNPVRAGMADTPEGSDHTSAQRRISTLNGSGKQIDGDANKHLSPPRQPEALYPFVGDPRQPMPEGLPFRLQDYLELLDWTGRAQREDKRGAIPGELPPILQRLNLTAETWLKLSSDIEQSFPSLVGRPKRIQTACIQLGQRWAHGLSTARRLFPAH